MRKLALLILVIPFTIFAQHDASRINQLRSEAKIDKQDSEVFDLLEEFYLQALQSDLGELSADMPKKIDKI